MMEVSAVFKRLEVQRHVNTTDTNYEYMAYSLLW